MLPLLVIILKEEKPFGSITICSEFFDQTFFKSYIYNCYNYSKSIKYKFMYVVLKIFNYHSIKNIIIFETYISS